MPPIETEAMVGLASISPRLRGEIISRLSSNDQAAAALVDKALRFGVAEAREAKRRKSYREQVQLLETQLRLLKQDEEEKRQEFRQRKEEWNRRQEQQRRPDALEQLDSCQLVRGRGLDCYNHHHRHHRHRHHHFVS